MLDSDLANLQAILDSTKSTKMDLLSRIAINPKVSFGKPTIRNLRYPVELVLELLTSGINEELLKYYPDLEKEDIQACLLFASKLVSLKSIHKV